MADDARAAVGAACRARLVESVRKVWTEAWGLGLEDNDEVGIVLSGGVDTCAVMEALRELGVKPAVALTVFVAENATDRPYAAKLAAEHAVRHVAIEVSPEDLLGQPLRDCVAALGTFDGMELRNSVVVARALAEARKLGLKYMLTGDGADELLGGYSFTHGSPDPLWTEKRDDMCSRWFFSAPVMGQAMGIQVASPFTHEYFKTWALELGKAECIAEVEQETEPGGARELRLAGKMPLRDAFPEALSAWRRKDPIEVGSGSTVLGADNGKYFEERTDASAFLAAKDEVAQEHKVAIRNAEHLFYFKVFLKVFPEALGPSHSYPVLPKRFSGASDDACIGCRFALPLPTSTFCRVCGAWPARRRSTSAALLS